MGGIGSGRWGGRRAKRTPGPRTFREKWGNISVEEAREKQRAYQAAYRSRPNFKAEQKVRQQKTYNKNKAIYYARSSHRVSLLRVAEVRQLNPNLPPQPVLTDEQREACIAIRLEAFSRTELTGEKHVVDHIDEIADGGLEVPENLQILTFEEHNRKSAAHRAAVREAYRQTKAP